MITNKTVLVLGAGASVPFGFPSGQVLFDIIRFFLNPGYPRYPGNGLSISQWLPSHLEWSLPESFKMLNSVFSKESLDAFGGKIYKSGEESIDAFLEYQTGEFLEIGKAAIAAVMLAFEREAALFQDFMKKRLQTSFKEGREKDGTENNWYQLLWRALSAPFEEFGNNQLRVVTFNYDRSLEYYLFTCLKNKYPDKKDGEYANLICPIVHIHGSLGALQWQIAGISDIINNFVPYNVMYENETDKDESRLHKLIRPSVFQTARNSITVIHESEDETPELVTARKWIKESQRLIFLGFGYHETNVKRLMIRKLVDSKTEVLGTIYGLSLDRYQYTENLFSDCKGVWSPRIRDCSLFGTTVYDCLHNKIVLT